MPIQPQEFVGDNLPLIDWPAHNLDQVKINLLVELLRTAGQVRLSVLGASMLPTIWPRDVITISKIEYGDVATGDIIAISRDGKVLVHRVSKCGSDGWITRGDSVSHPDSPIKATDLIGKVICIKRGSREFLPQKPSTAERLSGWLLCHSGFVRNSAMTWHARRVHRFVLQGHNNDGQNNVGHDN